MAPSGRPAGVPDHLAHLPVVGGLPVPDVAIWTGEQDPSLVELRIGPSGIVGGRGTVRQHGMTFLSLGNQRQGRGRPDFGATSSFRQRRSVTGPRCQVCGRRVHGDPYWIVPDEHGWLDNLDPTWTKQPPVCEACAETAPVWCPHLRHAPHTVTRQPGRLVAVWGDLYRAGQVRSGVVDLDDPARVYVLGRELIVALVRP